MLPGPGDDGDSLDHQRLDPFAGPAHASSDGAEQAGVQLPDVGGESAAASHSRPAGVSLPDFLPFPLRDQPGPLGGGAQGPPPAPAGRGSSSAAPAFDGGPAAAPSSLTDMLNFYSGGDIHTTEYWIDHMDSSHDPMAQDVVHFGHFDATPRSSAAASSSSAARPEQPVPATSAHHLTHEDQPAAGFFSAGLPPLVFQAEPSASSAESSPAVASCASASVSSSDGRSSVHHGPQQDGQEHRHHQPQPRKSGAAGGRAADGQSRRPEKPLPRADRKRVANNEASKRYRARKRQRFELAERKIEVLGTERVRLAFRYRDAAQQADCLHKSLTLTYSYARAAHDKLAASQAENAALRREVARLRGGAPADAVEVPTTPAVLAVPIPPVKSESAASTRPGAGAGPGLAAGAGFDVERAHDDLMEQMSAKLSHMAEVGEASAADLLDKIYICCQVRADARRKAADVAVAAEQEGAAAAAAAAGEAAASSPIGRRESVDEAKTARLWRVVEMDLDLSAEQLTQLRSVRATHRERLGPLAYERARASAALAGFMRERSTRWPELRKAKESAPRRELAEAEPLFAQLRAIMAAESRLLDSTLEALRGFLTPRQEATLVLRLTGHTTVDSLSVLRSAFR